MPDTMTSIDSNTGVHYKPVLYHVCALALAFACFYKVPSLITVALILLSIWALRGPKYAIQALSLAVVIKYLNPAAFSFSAYTGILGWLVILSATARCLPIVLTKYNKALTPHTIFFVVILLLTPIISANSAISLMKLIAYFSVVASLLCAAASLSRNDVHQLKTWFLSITLVVVVTSLPTLLLPAIGYNRNGSGFQGILNHPQSFGPFLAPFLSLLLLESINHKGLRQLVSVFVAVCLVTLILMSQTRTAALAVALGVVTVFLINVFGLIKANDFNKGRAIGFAIGGIMCLCVLVVSVAPVQEAVQSFVFKRESTNIDDALASRSGGIAAQWRAFLDQPLTGHGFGIYPNGFIPTGVTTFMGIPISAPVEKGFIPTAILEETGLIGAALFLWFVVRLSKQTIRNNNSGFLAIFFTCFYINLGEMVIFSVGGIGLYYWLLLSVAAAPGLQSESSPAKGSLKPLPETNQKKSMFNFT